MVQIVWRKGAPLLIQLKHIWLMRIIEWQHTDIPRHLIALAQITGAAGRDNILPCRFTTTGAGDEMVKGQVFTILGAAVLTAKAVPQKDIKAREGRPSGMVHISFEGNNGGQSH